MLQSLVNTLEDIVTSSFMNWVPEADETKSKCTILYTSIFHAHPISVDPLTDSDQMYQISDTFVLWLCFELTFCFMITFVVIYKMLAIKYNNESYNMLTMFLLWTFVLGLFARSVFLVTLIYIPREQQDLLAQNRALDFFKGQEIDGELHRGWLRVWVTKISQVLQYLFFKMSYVTQLLEWRLLTLMVRTQAGYGLETFEAQKIKFNRKERWRSRVCFACFVALTIIYVATIPFTIKDCSPVYYTLINMVLNCGLILLAVFVYCNLTNTLKRGQYEPFM